MEIGASALLEWVDTLEVAQGQRVQTLEDLLDGKLLLEAMRDISPEVFPAPGRGTPHLRPLLAGLQEHFRQRPGRGEAVARQLLEREAAGVGLVDPSLLVQLVIWATLDNDLADPRRQHYLEVCKSLSDFSKEAIMDIARHFEASEGSPQLAAAVPFAGRPSLGGELALSPPARATAVDDLPDFMEVGLDDETRYRRLKRRYHAVMEEQERLEDERNLLHRQLEAEIKKRQAAEEAERMARTELRESDEARHRMKEENRALFEVRLEQEAQKFREQLKQRDKQIEAMREEGDLARAQAGRAEKLSEQLGLCKKKLEESQAWKREKEDLRHQLDEVMSSKNSGSGSTDHLRIMLDRTRNEANVLLEERDEAQRHALQLQQELSQLREQHAAADEELSHLRREPARPREDNTSRGASSTAVGADGAGAQGSGLEPSVTPSGRSPKGASVDELRDLLHTQKDDLLERLLVEKERATRAETTLHLKQQEVTALTEQRAQDAETLRASEEASRAQAGRLSELESSRGQGGEDSGRVRELQAALAQRERELQIHRWRGQSESDSLVAQEALMVSCFHELGLRHRKLVQQHEALQRRLQGQARAGGVDPELSPARDEGSSLSAG